MGYDPVVTAQPVESGNASPKVKYDPIKEITVREPEETDDRPLMLLGTPYVAEVYGFSEDYNEDIDDFKVKMELIDTYLKTQILKKKWKPTIKSYKKSLEEFEEHLNLDEDMTEYDRIELMYYYLKGKYKL